MSDSLSSQHAWTPHQPADRVLMALKDARPQSIAAIAQTMDVTAEAVRQQMSRLHAEGLVDAENHSTGAAAHADLAAHGRPALSGHARRNDGADDRRGAPALRRRGHRPADRRARGRHARHPPPGHCWARAGCATGWSWRSCAAPRTWPSCAATAPASCSLKTTVNLFCGKSLHGLLPQLRTVPRSAGRGRARVERRAHPGGCAALRLPGRGGLMPFPQPGRP